MESFVFTIHSLLRFMFLSKVKEVDNYYNCIIYFFPKNITFFYYSQQLLPVGFFLTAREGKAGKAVCLKVVINCFKPCVFIRGYKLFILIFLLIEREC